MNAGTLSLSNFIAASELLAAGGKCTILQTVVQAASDANPAADEDEVQRGEAGDAQRGEFPRVDDACLEDVAGALEERIDRLLGLVFGLAAGRQPQRLLGRVAERVVDAVVGNFQPADEVERRREQ